MKNRPEETDTVLLTLWSDPGHAWLEVPPETLTMAIPDSIVSHYSHYGKRHGELAFFLEEDCDLALFLAGAARAGLAVQIDECDDVGECIRKLPQWHGCRMNRFEYRAIVRTANEELEYRSMANHSDEELYDLYEADPHSPAGRTMASRIRNGTWTLGATA